MTTELTAPLPALLVRAMATLEGATSAAEVLEAGRQADAAYSAAEIAERLLRAQGAHETVLATCRQMMGDAAVIEARAKVRLADEYDTAQARGEVQKAGGNRMKGIIPDENNAPAVTDIGITSKQVFNARQVRDAERADPGVVQRTVDAAVREGRAPKAEVSRAVAKATGRSPKKPTPMKPRALTNPEAVEREQIVGALRKEGKTTAEIAEQTGMHERNVAQVLEHVKIAEEAHARGFAEGVEQATLDPTKLYKSVQEQVERMKRQYAREVEAEVRRRFMADIREHYDGVLLPMLREKEAKANNVLMRRRGVLSRADYELIRSCLHEDHKASPEKLRRAFDLWSDKRDDVLLVEQVRIVGPAMSDFPATREEMLARKQKVKDDRAAKLRATREAKQKSA